MMKNHPAADAFPMMEKKRLDELLENIREHGQIEPITVCEGMILDGRNRYKACIELGIEPKTKTFDGDPWAYAWSLNGMRRDLVAEQRYLIWKFCSENSEKFQAERRRIHEEANRKRSEAAKEQPRSNDGSRLAQKQVVVQNVQPPAKQAKTRQASATAAKVNTGAVARGDVLASKRPDLAKKVMTGEIKPADAHRQMKRDQIIKNLESVEAVQAKKASGKYDVLVIDPPWQMEKIERDVAPDQVAFDYPTMSENELCDLEIPAADSCHVWLWTTHKFLPMAMRLLNHWKMKYVCTFVWHKPGGFQPFGLPQYNCEFALYARIGTPSFIDTKAFPVCFEAKRGKHSEKPEEFYELIRRVTAGRRLDMFNRRKILGFDGWGKEAAQ